MADTGRLFDSIHPIIRTQTLPELDNRARSERRSVAELTGALAPALKSTGLSSARGQLILGSALLWHDHLEDAHRISQETETSDGHLLHGIMHRREPDYSNAAYWFQRVGNHPIFPSIAREASAFLHHPNPDLERKLTPEGQWDPFAFIQACEAASRSAAAQTKPLLQEVQRIEFEAFLRHLCS